MDVLPGLAALLFKEGIIPEMALPTTAPVLLNALKDAICADYHNLEKFNEQGLRKWLKASIDELQEIEKEKNIAQEKLHNMQQQLQGKESMLAQSKEKEKVLQIELNKKQEEFAKKEKELSELQQLYHSKEEELAKTLNEFKHQLEKKEQEKQKYSRLLQEHQDALHTQKLKNESQNIQLLHHSPQSMYCMYMYTVCDSICSL